MANTYLFLNDGTAKSFATTYANVDTFKIDAKLDVANTGEVKVYKSLKVEKNLIVSGNATITGTINTIPAGVIVMWSGSSASIPAGWNLCDGANGTPDLRNRFIVGATGLYAVGATGGSANSAVVAHTHTATSSVTDPGHVHGNGAIHPYNGTGTRAEQDQSGGPASYTSFNVDTTNSTTGISVATTVNSTGSSGTNTNLPPYYALCFIMKA
jgi:microcystin-dependent protein